MEKKDKTKTTEEKRFDRIQDQCGGGYFLIKGGKKVEPPKKGGKVGKKK